MKLYYVETKSYYKDAYGTDHQTADAGETPILYTNKAKAIKRADFIVDIWHRLYGYDITIPNDKMPCKNNGCLYGARLEQTQSSARYEVRVYEIETAI